MTEYGQRQFYHATSHANYVKIMSSGGIDPDHARGKRKLAWYVEKGNVAWAIAHCIRSHNWSLNEIVVCRVMAHNKLMHQIGGGFMWVTKHTYPVRSVETGASFLVRDEMSRLAMEAKISGSDWYEHLR